MTKKLPSQKNLSAANAPEILSFEQALPKVREKINFLLKQRGVLSVAINGAGPDVGKTFLSGQIARELLEQNIPVGICAMPYDIRSARQQIRHYQEAFEEWIHQVYILNAWEVPHGIRQFGSVDIRRSYDQVLCDKTRAQGVSLKRVDLWIALSSQQTPFQIPPAWANEPYDPFEDVIILNEKAKIKIK